MNVEKLRKTRDAIAASQTFNQTAWGSPCGTPGCVAGHAVVESGWKIVPGSFETYAVSCTKRGRFRTIEGVATEELGLTEDEARKMFGAEPLGGGVTVTRAHALAMLDRAIGTGKVEWTGK